MFELPSTKEHFRKLQAEFNSRLCAAYDDAKEIVEERAVQYDTQKPVWADRCTFPGGMLHEVRKKTARIEAQIDEGEKCMVPDRWAHTRGDILDAVNYLLFMAVYGDMLHDELFPLLPDLDPEDDKAIFGEEDLEDATIALANAGDDEAQRRVLRHVGGPAFPATRAEEVRVKIEELRNRLKNEEFAILGSKDEEEARRLAAEENKAAQKALDDLEELRSESGFDLVERWRTEAIDHASQQARAPFRSPAIVPSSSGA